MKTIAITLTLLALTCSEEGEPDTGGRVPSVATDGGTCELVCHDYGGGIEDCTCTDGDGRAVEDLGPPRQVPDPYAPD